MAGHPAGRGPKPGAARLALDFVINGVALRPDRTTAGGDLSRAGLARLAGWRRLLRRLPAGCRYWRAADPHVVCFDGQLDIFACRDRYLDLDRQWGTELLLAERDATLQWLDIRIVDGLYAAGNYYDRFLEAIGQRLGQPSRNGRRHTLWRTADLQVEARLSADALDARFRLDWQAAAAGPAD